MFELELVREIKEKGWIVKVAHDDVVTYGEVHVTHNSFAGYGL